MHTTVKDHALELFYKAFEEQMKGNYERALQIYKESINLFPTAEACTFLGWTYSLLNDYPKAIDECLKAIALDPEFGNPYNDIGSYYYYLGKYDDAVPWLTAAMTKPRYESKHFPHYNLGRVYEMKGLWLEAIRAYKTSLEFKPDYEAAQTALARLRSWMN